MSELITKREAASILGVSTSTVDRYIRRGWLRKRKRGHERQGRVWLSRSQVEEVSRG